MDLVLARIGANRRGRKTDWQWGFGFEVMRGMRVVKKMTHVDDAVVAVLVVGVFVAAGVVGVGGVGSEMQLPLFGLLVGREVNRLYGVSSFLCSSSF